MKSDYCEICRHEDTKVCDTCPKIIEPVKMGPKEAIKYFEEENQRLDDVLGFRAVELIEYRANKEAIKALKEKGEGLIDRSGINAVQIN